MVVLPVDTLPQASSPMNLNVFSVSSSVMPSQYVLFPASDLMNVFSELVVGVASHPWRAPNDMPTAVAAPSYTVVEPARQT